MSMLIKNRHTIRTGRRKTVDVEVDHALELGLRFTSNQRRAFNALYLARLQTPSGWLSDAAILRIGWDYDPSAVSEAVVRATISRLRGKLQGTTWRVENVHGGMYRLSQVE